MPVIVFSYGGGFATGAGSEPRYDGEAPAKKGVFFVTYNYRLGAFGFFAHPELTKESDHHSSGNYAFMDLIAVLKWNTMTSYWANFAAKGDPNGNGLPVWPAYKQKTGERMVILGEKIEGAPELDAPRFALFDAEYARQSLK
jgi:carboxylesterase type B